MVVVALFDNACSEWPLLEVEAYNCIRLKPRQPTQVCTLIETDFLKPEKLFELQNFFFFAYS